MCRQRDGLHIMEPFFLVEILHMETMSTEANVSFVYVMKLGISDVAEITDERRH
jgi:hypothetical protein